MDIEIRHIPRDRADLKMLCRDHYVYRCQGDMEGVYRTTKSMISSERRILKLFEGARITRGLPKIIEFANYEFLDEYECCERRADSNEI